jgi:hypothetical protein
MRKTLLAATLMLGLCCSALAGEMSTPPIAPDPQPGSAQAQSTEDNTVTTESLIQTVLDVIVSALP